MRFLQGITIDILPLILAVLIFYKSAPVKGRGVYNEAYLSLNAGQNYRGAFALAVLLHHLAQKTSGGIIMRYMSNAGCYTAAFFFFLSGYGLQKSNLRGENYKKGFLIHRLPKIVIPYAVATAAFWALRFALGKHYSLKNVLDGILTGNPIDAYSWYVIVIIEFYIVFWLLMVVSGKKKLPVIAGEALWYFAFMLYCRKMKLGGWWYTSAHLLVVGSIWASYEEQILKLRNKLYWPLLAFSWLGFILTCFFPDALMSIISFRGMGAVLILLAPVFFTVALTLTCMKLKIGNPVTKFIGEISLEFYLAQGFAIWAFRNTHVYISNELLWCIAVFAATTVLAFVLHSILKMLFCTLKENSKRRA